PEELLQRFTTQVLLHERRSDRCHGEPRPGVAAGTAAGHVRAVRAGSMDDRPAVAAGRPALRAPDRPLPSTADGPELSRAHPHHLRRTGRPAPSEGAVAAVRRVL